MNLAAIAAVAAADRTIWVVFNAAQDVMAVAQLPEHVSLLIVGVAMLFGAHEVRRRHSPPQGGGEIAALRQPVA